MSLRARKRFGQHFLERQWVAKVVRAIAPRETNDVLEIGPGTGALTLTLAPEVNRIVAVEIDRDFARTLRETAPDNVEILEGDFLELTDDQLRRALPDGKDGKWRVVGNLPYNVASQILFRLVDLYRADLGLLDATLMVQREVADRLLASPGSRVYGIPSVLVRHSADIERVLDLPPGAFRPKPKVESTIVRLQFHADRPPAKSREALAELVRAVFTRRRKTLANALLAYRGDKKSIEESLARAGIDGRRRPESLDIADFVRLADQF